MNKYIAHTHNWLGQSTTPIIIYKSRASSYCPLGLHNSSKYYWICNMVIPKLQKLQLFDKGKMYDKTALQWTDITSCDDHIIMILIFFSMNMNIVMENWPFPLIVNHISIIISATIITTSSFFFYHLMQLSCLPHAFLL